MTIFSAEMEVTRVLAKMGRRISLSARRMAIFSATGRVIRLSGGKEHNKILGVEER